jgi:serine/threonine-protein kinase
VGNLIGGQFYIVEELPEGYFAKVYRVKDNVAKEEKALKALKPRFIIDPGRVDELVNEARNSMRLKHDNIVSVFGVNKEAYAGKEYPYVVMEYVKGGNLQDRLLPGQPLNFVECIQVMRDICLALIYTHQRKFIHCDIKPSNILYDSEETRWKLGDFGLAKIAREGEISSPSGTWWYMAPEAKEGKAQIKSDIYSLGLVFREMLTGSIGGDLTKIERLHKKYIDREQSQKLIDLIGRMLSRLAERPSIGEVYDTIKWEKTGFKP